MDDDLVKLWVDRSLFKMWSALFFSCIKLLEHVFFYVVFFSQLFLPHNIIAYFHSFIIIINIV